MNINYSRFKLYQTCPRQFFWRYVENLVLPKTAMPLLFGRTVHKGIETLLSGKTLEEAKQALLDDWGESPVALLPEERDLVEKHKKYALYVLEKYQKTYPVEEWTVLAPEVQGTTPLPGGFHTLKFRTDGIVSWRNETWLLEHKTTAALGPTFFNRFRMDGQITTYIWGVSQTMDVAPIGAVINAIFKARNLDKTDFARDIVMRTKDQIDEFIFQLSRTCDKLELKMQEQHAKKHWMMHTHSCFNYNRPCDYLELCYHDTPGVRELYVERSNDYVDEEET